MNSKDRYENYLKTDYWKAVSVEVKKRAGYRCQVCNSQMDLVAHHRCYDHRGKELEHLDDLICLCVRCHSLFHWKTEPLVEAKRQRKERKIQERQSTHVASGQQTSEMILARIDHEFIARVTDGLTDPVKLTDQLISNTCMNGSFTSATVLALGPDDMSKGWLDRLVGKELSLARYKQALMGRFIYASEFRQLRKEGKWEIAR